MYIVLQSLDLMVIIALQTLNTVSNLGRKQNTRA